MCLGIHDGHREKMRGRFLATGLEGFADHEVLELLLYYAIPRRDTNPIAHALVERYGSLRGVLSAPAEDLIRVPGMGEQSAVLIRLVAQIYERSRTESGSRPVILNSTEKAGEYLLHLLSGKTREEVVQLCLDRKGKLLACKRLREGGGSWAELNIRHLVENALILSASAVILCHNHPSGVALPSQDDFVTTERVRDALAAVGVVLVDHIIVADDDFVSMADSGYLRTE